MRLSRPVSRRGACFLALCTIIAAAVYVNGVDAVLAEHARAARPTDGIDLGRFDDWINALCFSPDGEQLAYGDGAGNVVVSDLTQEKPKRFERFFTGKHRIDRVLFSPNGQYLAVLEGEACKPELWHLSATKTTKIKLTGGEKPLDHLTFSPDSSTLVGIGAWNPDVRLWDLSEDKARTWSFPHQHTDCIYYAVFAPDGKTLLTRAGDNTIQYWEVDGRTVNRGPTIGEMESDYGPPEFAADGKSFIQPGLFGSKDGPPDARILWLEVWDFKSRKITKTYRIPLEGPDMTVAFSRDRKSLLVGDRAGVVTWWDVASEKQQKSWKLASGIHRLAFAPAGDRFAVGTDTGNVFVYALEKPD